jgi:hypothetical protein
MASERRGREIVKCAPTMNPQLLMSMRRLRARARQAGLRASRDGGGNSVRFGHAGVVFLSDEPGANVVGHTASLLLEVDEAQGVDEEKFDRDFRPMCAVHNATTVLYGTAWDERTLLERVKQANIDAQRRDGVRRHFQYDWQAVARHVPAYARYAEAERARLGETHPVWLTQYCLQPIAGRGRLFTAAQRALIAGWHARLNAPSAGEAYVAGLDFAGGHEGDAATPRRDATVLSIGRLVYPPAGAAVEEPRVEIVEHYEWRAAPHETLLPQIIALLRDTWRCARVAVDATGLGETAARLLAAALSEPRVLAVKFSAERKSGLGFALLAAVNGGRLKAFAGDGSPEHREFWRQMELARAHYRANQTMAFFVDEREGHDDYLVAAALLVEASRGQARRTAQGRRPAAVGEEVW